MILGGSCEFLGQDLQDGQDWGIMDLVNHVDLVKTICRLCAFCR